MRKDLIESGSAVSSREASQGKFISEPRIRLLAVTLIGCHVAMVAWMNWANSVGRTESGHLAAAAYWLETGRLDVFQVNPPLTRYFVAVPLSILHPNVDLSRYSADPIDRCEFDLATDFLAANDDFTNRRCVFWGRCSLIPLLVLGLGSGFLLARNMFGDRAALLFLTIASFSPTLLAWGATLCPDASAAWMGVIAFALFRRWLQRPGAAFTVMAGVSLGLMPLTKLTWIVAWVIWPTLWLLFRWRASLILSSSDAEKRLPGFRSLGLVLLISVITVNLGYGYEGSFRLLGSYRFYSKTLKGTQVDLVDSDSIASQSSESGNRFAGSLLAWLPVPFPAPMVQGVDTQRYDLDCGLPSYLAGQWSDHGWWYFYLYAFALKEPVGTGLLFLLAIFRAVTDGVRSALSFDALSVAFVAVGLFSFVSTQTGFSVNSRYSIVALPFIYLWLSRMVGVGNQEGECQTARTFGRRALHIAAWSSSILFVISSLAVFPYCLSYFNLFAGGPSNGGNHLVGSNHDAGQDLFRLRRWLQQHPEVELSGCTVSTSYPRDLEGMPDIGLVPPAPMDWQVKEARKHRDRFGPRPGLYAISVNFLHDRQGKFDYFRESFHLVERVGSTINIYRITEEDANRWWDQYLGSD